MDPELDKSYMTVINESPLVLPSNDGRVLVLDHGYIELLDHMGNDLMVVNTARVSFNKHHKIFGSQDERLIGYLAEHGHWSPFAHPKIHLRIKMPIFVHRQWDKTRVGFDRNEMSRRYVDSEPEFYEPKEWRGRPEKGQTKQGSNGVVTTVTPHQMEESLEAYKDLIQDGVAPEQARIVLPLATYTEFIETGSLYGYARLYGLRASEDAQWEIREYAKALDKIMSGLFPVSWPVLKKQPLPEDDLLEGMSEITLKSDKDIETRLKSIEDILKDIREKKYTEARQVDNLDKGTDYTDQLECCYGKPTSGYCNVCHCTYYQDDMKQCAKHREQRFPSR